MPRLLPALLALLPGPWQAGPLEHSAQLGHEGLRGAQLQHRGPQRRQLVVLAPLERARQRCHLLGHGAVLRRSQDLVEGAKGDGH